LAQLVAHPVAGALCVGVDVAPGVGGLPRIANLLRACALPPLVAADGLQGCAGSAAFGVDAQLQLAAVLIAASTALRSRPKLVAERRPRATAAVGESRWLFPGGAPGRPMDAQVLSRRLKRIGVDCADARRTALMQLGGEMPAPVIDDLLGIHVDTANKWAQIAGRPWGDYPTLR